MSSSRVRFAPSSTIRRTPSSSRIDARDVVDAYRHLLSQPLPSVLVDFVSVEFPGLTLVPLPQSTAEKRWFPYDGGKVSEHRLFDTIVQKTRTTSLFKKAASADRGKPADDVAVLRDFWNEQLAPLFLDDPDLTVQRALVGVFRSIVVDAGRKNAVETIDLAAVVILKLAFPSFRYVCKIPCWEPGADKRIKDACAEITAMLVNLDGRGTDRTMYVMLDNHTSFAFGCSVRNRQIRI